METPKKFVLIVSIFGIFALSIGYLRSRAPTPLIDGPPLLVASADEIRGHIEKSKGLVLVNLWASWCGPCKVEFPALLEIRKKYPQIELMFISLDNEEQRGDALQFLASHGVDFPTYFKGEQSMGYLSHLFPQWPGAIPASFLANNKLEIMEAWIGEATLRDFENMLSKHLPNP